MAKKERRSRARSILRTAEQRMRSVGEEKNLFIAMSLVFLVQMLYSNQSYTENLEDNPISTFFLSMNIFANDTDEFAFLMTGMDFLKKQNYEKMQFLFNLTAQVMRFPILHSMQNGMSSAIEANTQKLEVKEAFWVLAAYTSLAVFSIAYSKMLRETNAYLSQNKSKDGSRSVNAMHKPIVMRTIGESVKKSISVPSFPQFESYKATIPRVPVKSPTKINRSLPYEPSTYISPQRNGFTPTIASPERSAPTTPTTCASPFSAYTATPVTPNVDADGFPIETPVSASALDLDADGSTLTLNQRETALRNRDARNADEMINEFNNSTPPRRTFGRRLAFN